MILTGAFLVWSLVNFVNFINFGIWVNLVERMESMKIDFVIDSTKNVNM